MGLSTSKAGYTIQCDQQRKGSNGCFLTRAHIQRLEALHRLWNDPNVTINDLDYRPVDKSGLWTFITSSKQPIGIKIYYQDIPQQRINEVMAYTTLKQMNLLNYTTYAEYNHNACFVMNFKDKKVTIDKHPVGSIAFALFNECMPLTEAGDFDATKFVDDIRPLMTAMHRNGYAHLDIRPSNIVKCDDRYKLIDLSLAHPYSSSLQATPQYMIPGSHRKLGFASPMSFIQRMNLLLEVKKDIKLSKDTMALLKHYMTECKTYCDKADTEDTNYLFYKSDEFAIAMTIFVMTGDIHHPLVKQLLSKDLYFNPEDGTEGGAQRKKWVRYEYRTVAELRKLCDTRRLKYADMHKKDDLILLLRRR